VKRTSKFLWTVMVVLLVISVGASLAVSCKDDDGNNGTGTGASGTGTAGGGTGTASGGKLGNGKSDWNIAAGAQNSISEEDGALVIKWSVAAAWGLVELSGVLPASLALEEYDAVQFDIKIDTFNNYLILIRPQGSAAAWKLYEGYIDSSSDWQTVQYSFEDGTPQWGSFEEPDLAAYLNGNKSATKLLFICPILNPGDPADPERLGAEYTTYLRNIGFTKEGSNDVTLVW